jgi:cholesterol transport system auxiliary component
MMMSKHAILSRRAALAGAAAASLGGCSAVSALNSAATVLPTYDLTPRSGATSGAQSRQTLVVASPDAPAAIATDRILIRPSTAAITYLPDARWSDALPLVVQSLLIRAIAGTGRIAYVGRSSGGPVPDLALLTRIDAFDVTRRTNGLIAHVDLDLSLLQDRSQRVIASARFAQSQPLAGDQAATIVAGFQQVLDVLLPQIADWVLAQA